ncbi:uncharacterized protein EURHEDRAFT_390005 [Aspergillus ruber CBS 135680]|uniref:Uncharacterized protein n=1 Tax=Aspergillus ruber (strain CBS 135680) TaxID=1388766 RepID=A0A017S3Q8_ASPRC|nr:uncharacterized protein EURHEDRAFT_390005 [Aspergillus ruber CBS 135680]EYE90830.1 hypothetical protein EURHEDRAFT_390005 [Aspergillus ruber CBS 135680]
MYQPLQSLVSWVTSERGIYILRRTGLAIQAICVARSLWAYHSTDKELVEARKEADNTKKGLERLLIATTFLLRLEKALRRRQEEVLKEALESTGVLSEVVVDDAVDRLFTEVLPTADIKEFPDLFHDIIEGEETDSGSYP